MITDELIRLKIFSMGNRCTCPLCDICRVRSHVWMLETALDEVLDLEQTDVCWIGEGLLLELKKARYGEEAAREK